ncbi:hypothetical protein SAMN05660776_2333 [Salegentibacter holothuriorum]|uniref:Alpha/beta hydrolase family protein n=1 Tax=Salegentibacter holothuriorum TaxID=241145 RepID=A0A1T5D2F7_9FLAO|nr:hypothetical protein [Salegentibacter holothuriorum]SKB65849.1 hypothetical protein SAMN05660776_2333 [Salegentibacter holothuriorum]
MMKKIPFLVLLLSFIPQLVSSQEIKIPLGTIVDSIPISDTIEEGFAIYLPRNFDEKKEWPVIFVFDPQGRGRAAAQLFRTVAERQSYIIVASNMNLKEDSLKNNITKIGSLINQVDGMFTIDREQVYLAGLSEGGQLATALPFIYNNISGVLAIEDAWLNTDYLNTNSKFMFSAVACDNKNTRQTLVEIEAYLNGEDFPTEINFYTCKGKVEWPVGDVIENAVAGFTLLAIKEEKRPKDIDLIRKLYNAEVEHAQVLRRTRNYYQAFEKLKQIEDKYDDFGLEIDLGDEIKNIRRNKAFKQQRRDYRNAIAEENTRREDYIYYMDADVMISNFENIGWWVSQVDELKERVEKSSGPKQNMANRLLGFLDSLSKSYYDSYVNSQANARSKVFVSILRTIFDKNDPEAYLNIIKIAGHDGDHETALLYLEDLLKTGFKDMQALYDIEGILDLKLSKAYNEKIREYLGEAKYYNADS